MVETRISNLPTVGSIPDLVRCLKLITDLYEQLQGHPTSTSREARACLAAYRAGSVTTGTKGQADE